MGQAETATGARELRREVVQDLRDHPGVYRPFFAQDLDRPYSADRWGDYLRVMGRDVREWGDNLTLLGIARVRKLRIHLLTADGEYDRDVGPADGRSVWMAFRRESHYDALLPVTAAGVPKVGVSPAPKRPKPDSEGD